MHLKQFLAPGLDGRAVDVESQEEEIEIKEQP